MISVVNAYFCRVEDVTDPDTLRKQPKTDRSVCLYGYVRGCHYRNHTHVHIPGLSSSSVQFVCVLSALSMFTCSLWSEVEHCITAASSAFHRLTHRVFLAIKVAVYKAVCV